jgi:putative cell wall-binding protein
LKSLKEVKDKIVEAKSSGVDVSIAVKIFQQAKDTLKKNDFSNAKTYSALCEKQLTQD